MAKLVDLLRWKKPLLLLDAKGKPILDAKGKPVTVWIRIIGDEAQQEAYRSARLKSAERRAALKDTNSADYKDQILPISDADKDVCIELIKLSRGNNFISEALANVVRPNLPKLEEVAIDADAPTLEEQEKLDDLIRESNDEYEKSITEYTKTKQLELDAELNALELEDLRAQAMFETVNTVALTVFLTEVQNQKAWRSVYMDEKCTDPAYDSVEEFNSQVGLIKTQVLEFYNDLETSPNELKN